MAANAISAASAQLSSLIPLATAAKTLDTTGAPQTSTDVKMVVQAQQVLRAHETFSIRA